MISAVKVETAGRAETRNRGAALGSRCVLLFPYVLSRRIEHGLLAYGPSRMVAAVKAAEKKLFISPA